MNSRRRSTTLVRQDERAAPCLPPGKGGDVTRPSAQPHRSVRVTAALITLRSGPVLPLAVAVLIFASLDNRFLLRDNLLTIITAISFSGIVAVGETLLISTGEFDLSIGAAAGLAAYSAAQVMVHHGTPIGIGVGVGVGIGLGLLNALLVVGFRIPSFLATIGMLYVDKGLTDFWSRGRAVYPLPASFTNFGAAKPLGLSWAVITLVVLSLAGEAVLRYTSFGRHLLATGGNADAARIGGVRTRRVKVAAFALTGLLAGVAGLFQSSALLSGDPTIGSGWELLVIAGVVIGGTNLFGGSSTQVGTLLGMLLLQVVNNGLISVGIALYWQELIVGLIMILSLAINLARIRMLQRITAALVTQKSRR